MTGVRGPAVRARGGWCGATGAVLAILCLAALLPGRLAAQIPTPTIDTSAAADSARDDSLRHDATDRLLTADARAAFLVPALPGLGGEGPKALGSRIVLDRRTIAWHTAQNVADLLLDVPGVYVWRGGWHGRPVYANYRGRGATSVEWFVDGVPYAPMGPDSVGVDPGLFALTFFERIEIEQWPSGLRVFLYTPQHQSLAPRSRVGVTTGEFKNSRFQGDLEYRWRNGLGFTTAAEVFDSPTGSGLSSDAHLNSGLLRAEWVPRPDVGLQVQLMSQSPDIRPFVTEGDTIGAPLKGSRSEMQVRLFGRRGDEARHLQADLLYTRSSWKGEGIDQVIAGEGAVLAYRAPRWRVAGQGWFRDGPTRKIYRGEGGYVPFDRLSLDGEAVREEYTGGRNAQWTGVRAGLALPLGMRVEGAARQGSRVVAPALAADTAQDISETSLRGVWDLRYLTLSGGVSSTAGFQPSRFQPYLLIDSLHALGRTKWVDLGATLRPVNWLTLDAWYSDPQGTAPQGLPPTHSLVRGEIRSKFLRRYPSGIFELRLAAEMETWGHGVIGMDSTGTAIPLRGATFYRLDLALKLAGFQFFWDRVNVRSTALTYVPGFKIPGLGQTFGMRWEFSN